MDVQDSSASYLPGNHGLDGVSSVDKRFADDLARESLNGDLEHRATRAMLQSMASGDRATRQATIERALSHGVQASQSQRPVQKAKPAVLTPPGDGLSSLLEILLTRRAYENVVKPQFQDVHWEYIDTIAGGRSRYARWIAVRGCMLVIWSLLKRPLIGAIEFICSVLR